MYRLYVFRYSYYSTSPKITPPIPKPGEKPADISKLSAFLSASLNKSRANNAPSSNSPAGGSSIPPPPRINKPWVPGQPLTQGSRGKLPWTSLLDVPGIASPSRAAPAKPPTPQLAPPPSPPPVESPPSPPPIKRATTWRSTLGGGSLASPAAANTPASPYTDTRLKAQAQILEYKQNIIKSRAQDEVNRLQAQNRLGTTSDLSALLTQALTPAPRDPAAEAGRAEIERLLNEPIRRPISAPPRYNYANQQPDGLAGMEEAEAGVTGEEEEEDFDYELTDDMLHLDVAEICRRRKVKTFAELPDKTRLKIMKHRAGQPLYEEEKDIDPRDMPGYQEYMEYLRQEKLKQTGFVRPPVRLQIAQTIHSLSAAMGIKIPVLLNQAYDFAAKAGITKRWIGPQDLISMEQAELLCIENDVQYVKPTGVIEKMLNKIKDSAEYKPRAPVVCIVGHVDHGKTTLLDTLRNTNRVAQEAGRITQAIGAFTVDIPNPLASGQNKLTFLDTPGHAAFRSMRARGTSPTLTDIGVLVVAADDGVQPQTIEAIRMAQKNHLPMVVAINKVDVQPDTAPVHAALKQHGVISDKEGGEYVFVEISALKKQGMDELLDAIALQAEMMELKARFNGNAAGAVVETRFEPGLGYLLDVVVRQGELKIGDQFVCGTEVGKVKVLITPSGERVKRVGPSEPVSVAGIESAEGLGHELIGVDSLELANEFVAETQSRREYAELLQKTEEEQQRRWTEGRVKKSREEKLNARLAKEAAELAASRVAEVPLVPIIIKVDVMGSLEAIEAYATRLPDDMAKIKIIRSVVGAPNRADVDLAVDFGATIFCFNVRVPSSVKSYATSKKITIHAQDVIYPLMDNLKSTLTAALPKITHDEITGTARVRKTFAFKERIIAGCGVITGSLKADHRYRVYRGQYRQMIFEGRLESLKHFQDEVQSVDKGKECGLMLQHFDDLQLDDEIECYTTIEIPQTIDDSAARMFGGNEYELDPYYHKKRGDQQAAGNKPGQKPNKPPQKGGKPGKARR